MRHKASRWGALPAVVAISAGCVARASGSAEDNSDTTSVDGGLAAEASASAAEGGGPPGLGADGSPDGGAVGAGTVTCGTDPCATAIAVGGWFGCALMHDRTVRCWGTDQDGELARVGGEGGGGPASSVAVAIAGLPPVVEIAAGITNVCARTEDGKLYCWGSNYIHESSVASPLIITTPTAVALPAPVSRLTMGSMSVCALLTDGRVFCWGESENHSLGVDDKYVENYRAPVPAPMIGVLHPDLLETYMGASCAVSDGVVRCIGLTTSYGVADAGTPTTLPDAKPVVLPGRVRVLSSGNSTQVCVGLDTGATMCWGGNVAGQADPTTQTSIVTLPQSVDVRGATAIHGSLDHTCALANGEVWCWGANDMGELGSNAPARADAIHVRPVRVDLPARGVAISGGPRNSCALLETGAVHCWGANDGFALGRGPDGPAIGAPAPVPAPVHL